MFSTVSYVFPLVPGGMFLGTLLLLLIVPVFALAALALAVLLAAVALVGLVAAATTVPVLLVRAVGGKARPAPSLDAVRRALWRRRRNLSRRTSTGEALALVDRVRQLG